MRRTSIWIAAVAILFHGNAVRSESVDFQSASTVEEVRHQIESLKKDDIWWVVNGKDMAWNNKNQHRIFPTVNVYRDGPVRDLAYQLKPELANYTVDTPEGPMRYVDFLDSDQSTTMGMVILQGGKIVFERYPRMQPYEKPIYWSVTKVFVSTVVAILEDRGLIDVSKPIDDYIPELKKSPFAGVTVRNVLDMATGVDCPDDYEDKSACYYQFSTTIGEGFRDENSPDSPYTYLANLQAKRVAEQGTSYEYAGVNTFILGWLVEKVTGMPFQDALSREIWSRIGAENDASMVAPRYGIPAMDGGLLARLRDVARFGLLFTPSYKVVSDEKIVSDRYVELIRNGGNPKLLANARSGQTPDEDVKHNVYQWDRVFTNNDFYKGGWAGQGLLVNPDRDLVAVYTGYWKDDEYSEVSPLPVLRSVLNGVYGQRQASR